MKLEIVQGNPGMVDATAFILPTNENLTFRNHLGNILHAVGGPLVQNDAIRQAPKKRGDVVPIHAGATSYSRIYGAVAYPFRDGDFEWEEIEAHLRTAILAAYAEGHRKIAVPLFIDLPAYDVNVFGRDAATAMFHGAVHADLAVRLRSDGESDLHIIFVAKEPREYDVLTQLHDELYGDGLTEEADKDADTPPETTEDAPAEAPSEPQTETPAPEPTPEPVKAAEKADKPKSRSTSRTTTKRATTSRSKSRTSEKK